jgi:hypothetical protein
LLHSWFQSLRHRLRNIPVDVLELAPPYVQTELTGAQQASHARAMPLPAYVAEMMQLLELAGSSLRRSAGRTRPRPALGRARGPLRGDLCRDESGLRRCPKTKSPGSGHPLPGNL